MTCSAHGVKETSMQHKEIWRPLKGYEDRYLISDMSNIYSIRSQKEMGYFISVHGYRIATIRDGKETKKRPVHRLVAKTFIENTENKPCVNHKDGNKENNRVDNLEWVTHSENSIHAFETGLRESPRGNEHWTRRNPTNAYKKLSDEKIIEIEELLKEDKTQKEIAQKYNIDQALVSRIKHGKTAFQKRRSGENAK